VVGGFGVRSDRVVQTAADVFGFARLYDELYRRLYERLRPLYEEIRSITGYPG
jgi:hypothetical protein